MAFMELQITDKGTYATCECSRCGTTNHWHEWISEMGLPDFPDTRCFECGSPLDKETLWVSKSRNYYAGRLSAPGFLDCTEWSFGTNKKELIRELRDLYGDE